MDMRKTGVGSAAWAKQDRTAFGANTPEGDEGAVGRTNFLCDVGLTYQRRYSSVLCADAVTSSLGTMPALMVLLEYGGTCNRRMPQFQGNGPAQDGKSAQQSRVSEPEDVGP